MEASRATGRARASRSSKGCGCWPACRPTWPTTARRRRAIASGRSSMPGEWLGDMLAKMRSPENLQPPAAAGALEGDLAPVPGDGRQLAVVPLAAWGWGPAWPTTWDWARRSRCLACCWLARQAAARQTVAAGAAGLAAGQLEGGDRPLRADAARRVRASGRDVQGGTRPHRRPIRRPPLREVGRRGDHLRHAAAAGVAAGACTGDWSCSTRPRPSRIPLRRQTKAVKRLRGRCADRADRHAGREPAVGPLVAVRFPLPGPAGLAGQVQGVRQDSWTSARSTATRRCGTWCSRTSCGG